MDKMNFAPWNGFKELAFTTMAHFRQDGIWPFLPGFLLSCGVILYMNTRRSPKK
jgi:hypothetical protein